MNYERIFLEFFNQLAKNNIKVNTITLDERSWYGFCVELQSKLWRMEDMKPVTEDSFIYYSNELGVVKIVKDNETT